MDIYCLESFKVEVEKLCKNNSYSSVEKDIIEHFFNKSNDELINGTRLNNSSSDIYIKKRLKGSGGFRIYFYVIIKDSCLYLMYIHPKTGKYGCDNISSEAIKDYLKKVLEAIKSKDLYLVQPDSNNTKLIFNKKNQKSS